MRMDCRLQGDVIRATYLQLEVATRRGKPRKPPGADFGLKLGVAEQTVALPRFVASCADTIMQYLMQY